MEGMWTRAELKEKGKAAFKKNYWICVIVSMILALAAGTGSSNTDSQVTVNMDSGSDSSAYDDFVQQTIDEVNVTYTDNNGNDFSASGDGGTAEGYSYSIPKDYSQELLSGIANMLRSGNAAAAWFVMMVKLILSLTGFWITILAAVAGLLFAFFVGNVLEVGGNAFFIENRYAKPGVGKILQGFRSGHYLNVVKIMFFRDFYTLLWSLLLIIPGIVKSYEYRMVPYLLAEFPDMSKQEAFARSKEMMDGNKWDTFILDTSFILWWVLSTVTLGLVGCFYVRPYQNAVGAELYNALTLEQTRTD